MDVRRLRPEEARELREIRLRALADAPLAFAGTHEEERARPVGFWEDAARRWSTSQSEATFVAVDRPGWVGLVASFVRADAPGAVELVSLWTAPEVRGTGRAPPAGAPAVGS